MSAADRDEGSNRTPDVSGGPAHGGGRRRVLVIDDEPHMQRILTRLLSTSFEAHAVDSAREALDRLRRGERFDLLLCDLIMPQMSGMALYAELERIEPDLARRIVFMTGGAVRPEAHAFIEKLRGRVIEKPFEYARLERVLRDIFEQGADASAKVAP